MENEIYNCEIDLPTDLGSATDAELSAISSALKIDLPFTFLREIGRSLIKNKTKADKDILLFFSSLQNEAKKNIENISLAELFANDSEVLKTLNDLYVKAKYIKAPQGTHLRFNELINIAPSYLACVGAHAPKLFSKNCDSEKIELLDENKNKMAELSLDLSPSLSYGYVKEGKAEAQNKKPLMLVHGTELLLISAKTPDLTDYSERCKKMIQDERANELCLTAKTVDKLGLIGALADLPCGAYIDLNNLSSFEEEISVCDIITEFKGQLLAVAAFSRADELKALAEEYGLLAVSVAKVLEHPFIIIANNTKTANIEKQLIYRAIRMASPVSLKTKAEVFGPTNTKSSFTIVRKDGHTEEFNNILPLSEKVLLSAISSESLSFTDGINTALDTLFLLLAKGADRRKAEFSFKIRSKYEDMSKMVSAILGIYRVIMEFCLPDSQSTLEFTSSDDQSNMLFCSAGIKTEQNIPAIPDTFSQSSIGNKLYLLSFKRIKDTSPAFMPDFAAVRNTCDNLYTLISDGNALSVKAFNTSINKAIKEMCGDRFNVIPEGMIPINDDLFMQGFLVETSPKTALNLPLLGRIDDYVPEAENELDINELSPSTSN